MPVMPGGSSRSRARQVSDRLARAFSIHATPLDRWYQRHTGGVLLPVELQEIKRESGNKGGKGYDSAAY